LITVDEELKMVTGVYETYKDMNHRLSEMLDEKVKYITYLQSILTLNNLHFDYKKP
jgi:hypothetical protein